jgi:hypothetical protein
MENTGNAPNGKQEFIKPILHQSLEFYQRPISYPEKKISSRFLRSRLVPKEQSKIARHFNARKVGKISSSARTVEKSAAFHNLALSINRVLSTNTASAIRVPRVTCLAIDQPPMISYCLAGCST